MNVLLVGYGRMGRAIHRVLEARGHLVAGCVRSPTCAAGDPVRKDRGEPPLFHGIDTFLVEMDPSNPPDLAT